MAPQRIEVWRGCASSVASAVETFSDQWVPYSSKSRTRSIFKLFEEIIEPVWHDYLHTLPLTYSGRVVCQRLELGRLARAVGFQTVESIVAGVLRNLRQNNQASRHANIAYAHEFEMTLEMMRVILRACYAKRPKTHKTRINRLDFQICRYCGEDTEHRTQAKQNYEPEGVARFSTVYCAKHRPKFRDGTSNSEYLRAARHKEEFENEVKRMQCQSTSIAKPNAQTGDAFLDLFYFKLLAPHAIYADDEKFIRNEARALVNERVDDRKKRMVMMRASGLSLAAIAEAVGAKSRQAASKAIASIPSAYRFDIKAAPPTPEDLMSGLDASVVAAMNDNDIVEIHLNADGVLWAESRVAGLQTIGTISTYEANTVIQRVAEKVGRKLTEKHPVLEADIASAYMSFTAILPPITKGPTFAIRKMQADE